MQFKARSTYLVYSAAILALATSLVACGGGADTTAGAGDGAADGAGVTGAIAIDGSSTVYPISEAMAEEFQIANPGTSVTVGNSGSGGGFKKFCAGEIDISNASRQIKDEEIASCEAAGVEFIEVPVAYDGITFVTNKANDFASCLTTDQLKTIWAPESEAKVTNWNQVDPSFPDKPMELFGPGTDSGTFDYLTEEINGESGASRGDYTA
ncbi:MAG: substrate-binding domain-containing protein, partial [Phormidesmis sp.]